MYFSITFGPTAANPKINLNFGALNRDGGERRLNVAVTRARQQMIVYSSFTADQLDAARSKSVGLNHLKQFLDFAESGGQKLLDGQTQDSVGGFDSPFEQSVSESLELRGWQVLPQIGVSGFRIDLGVRHPDQPGAYLAGVECDGATYHRSAAARDRDKTRQLVLEGLGWNILRVWSPDWWYAKEEVVNKLDEQLNKLLEIDRSETDEEVIDISLDEVDVQPVENDVLALEEELVLTSHAEQESKNESKEDDELQLESAAFLGLQTMEKTEPKTHVSTTYDILDLGDCSSDSDRFHDDDYRESIRLMSQRILSQQGPIREDMLASQIARAHGFKRTGAKIRDHILAQIKDCPSTGEVSGRFLWSWDHPIEASIPYRHASDDSLARKENRTIPEISIAELCGLVRSNFLEMNNADDPVVFLARKVGIGRVSQTARIRISNAIERAREMEGTS